MASYSPSFLWRPYQRASQVFQMDLSSALRITWYSFFRTTIWYPISNSHLYLFQSLISTVIFSRITSLFLFHLITFTAISLSWPNRPTSLTNRSSSIFWHPYVQRLRFYQIFLYLFLFNCILLHYNHLTALSLLYSMSFSFTLFSRLFLHRSLHVCLSKRYTTLKGQYHRHRK